MAELRTFIYEHFRPPLLTFLNSIEGALTGGSGANVFDEYALADGLTAVIYRCAMAFAIALVLVVFRNTVKLFFER